MGSVWAPVRCARVCAAWMGSPHVCARIRPMGVAFEYKGKLYFCTNNKKALWKQLKAKPHIEICASNGLKWLRLSGKVGFDSDRAARAAALDYAPMLKGIYNPDDGVFEVFYFESAKGAFEDLQGGKKELAL